MSLWFRFYSDAMRHPKVARLSDAEFRLWVDLLCVASERDGVIPCLDDLKHILKRRLDHLSRGVEALIRGSLMEPLGEGYKPCGWDKRQYKSDSSTSRVQKHREKRNVSETPPETETEPEADNAEAKASGGQSPADITKAVWLGGVEMLKAAGHPEKEARKMLGRLRKDYSDSQMLVVLSKAQIEQPHEPYSWIIETLKYEAKTNVRTNQVERATTLQTGWMVAAEFEADESERGSGNPDLLLSFSPSSRHDGG